MLRINGLLKISCLGFKISTCIYFLSSCTSLSTLGKESEVNGSGSNMRRKSLFGSLQLNANENSKHSVESGNLRTEASAKQKKHAFEIAQAKNPSVSMQKIDTNTWRTSVNAQAAFHAVSKTLAKSYTINSNDRKNFNIQTDWDKFFVEGRLFRNKVNVTVFPISTRTTEVVIKNSLEYLATSNTSPTNGKISPEDGTWLPCQDITDEVKRIVENSSQILGKMARDSQLTY